MDAAIAFDDVFVEKTGYHLEEESEENAEQAPVEA